MLFVWNPECLVGEGRICASRSEPWHVKKALMPMLEEQQRSSSLWKLWSCHRRLNGQVLRVWSSFLTGFYLLKLRHEVLVARNLKLKANLWGFKVRMRHESWWRDLCSCEASWLNERRNLRKIPIKSKSNPGGRQNIWATHSHETKRDPLREICWIPQKNHNWKVNLSSDLIIHSGPDIRG